MKKAGAILAFLVICIFLLMLQFGVPAPNVLNRAYTGVVANIREHNGDLSVNNLELNREEAQDVLKAIQSHSYARRFPDGNVSSYGSTREIIAFLLYREGEEETYDIFTINSAGVIGIGDFDRVGGYLLLPRSDRAQVQLFQTIYDVIPK
ncbi:MAG TPA: hypothetical protein VN366_03870 [Feifaniaceae bacterium]|nr:hypothetical protein [Feifaniaceae bacterium]